MIDMDIIATGIGAASNARIKEICDYIRKVHVSITIVYQRNFLLLTCLVFRSCRMTSVKEWSLQASSIRICTTTSIQRLRKATLEIHKRSERQTSAMPFCNSRKIM